MLINIPELWICMPRLSAQSYSLLNSLPLKYVYEEFNSPFLLPLHRTRTWMFPKFTLNHVSPFYFSFLSLCCLSPSLPPSLPPPSLPPSLPSFLSFFYFSSFFITVIFCYFILTNEKSFMYGTSAKGYLRAPSKWENVIVLP